MEELAKAVKLLLEEGWKLKTPFGQKVTIKYTEENKKKMREECYDCEHKREVPGNYHIQCVKPDAKMRGSKHGIKEGWFMYPLLFDPVWKEKLCSNYEPTDSVNRVVSDAVSSEN